MITIKEYSYIRKTTTQAVYKLLKKYDYALEGHIKIEKGRKYIDEEGVRILESIASNANDSDRNEILPIDSQQQEKIEKLEKELESAKNKVAELYEEMRQKDNFIIGLQQSNKMLMIELEEEKEKKWWKKIFK